jgi:transposase
MRKINTEQMAHLRERMKIEKNVNAYKRMQAVVLRGEGKKRSEIAKITGYHPQWIGQLCKTYETLGIEGLIEDKRKGGNHRNMNDEAEAIFIEKFKEEAEKGQIVTIHDISKAYDKSVGKEHKSLSTVYYLLHKLGWRKVVPKQYHPKKASDEVIEASKKLTLS